MPVKKDTMANEGEEVRSKRVSRKVREADFVYQGGVWERGSSKKGTTKRRRPYDPFSDSLVKIELDAVQALADFSRLAHMPSKHSSNELKWSAKRRRSIRLYEAASSVKVEYPDTHVPANSGIPFGNSQRSELDSMASLSQVDKASPPFDSRADSPSSPLPASKMACRTFLVSGNCPPKSAFERVIPAEPERTPNLASIKVEMEDLQSENLPLTRQKPRTNKAPVSLCSVKTELSGEQEEGCKDVKNAGAMVLANLASQLVKLSHEVGRAVLNKPKAVLNEEDKEARRLRRIQANRESARQTIRKKQILCEELRRQAASLASENEGMKQKKETLIQELFFLKGQNYHLKTEVFNRFSFELETGPSFKLEAGTLQHLQGIPVSPPAWQAPSLPYTGFPSHMFGWPPGMMVQGGVANDTKLPDKIDSMEECSRNLGGNQFTQLLSTGLMVPGIPVLSSPVFVNGATEQKCSNTSNDVFFLGSTSSPQEESGAGGVETLKSSVASCDVDSANSNAHQQGIEREVDAMSLTKPDLTSEKANVVQERGTLCRPTALLPFRGDNAFREKQKSRSRALESAENQMGLPLALPVTCGSSCTGCIRNMPLNAGPGLADLYAWTTAQQTVAAAAEARKRRLELTRRKRVCSKRLKLVV